MTSTVLIVHANVGSRCDLPFDELYGPLRGPPPTGSPNANCKPRSPMIEEVMSDVPASAAQAGHRIEPVSRSSSSLPPLQHRGRHVSIGSSAGSTWSTEGKQRARQDHRQGAEGTRSRRPVARYAPAHGPKESIGQRPSGGTESLFEASYGTAVDLALALARE